MKIRKRYIILAALFALYFGLRLYFSLQSDYFSNDTSYFALRQIEHIAETGKPIITDSLSYGGRVFVFMPLYYYLLAFFTLLFPKIVIIKIVNNFFASTLILVIYLITSRIIQNRKISIICAIMAATIPAYINETINNISPYSFIVPGIFFVLFLFMSIDKKKVNYLVPLTIALVFSSSSTLIIIFGLFIYVLISYLETYQRKKIETEFLFFFLFFFLWSNFIIFKTAYLEHGLNIIWNNTPSSLLSRYFTDINFLQILGSVGLLPLFLGTYTTYNYILKKRSRKIVLFISIFLSTLVLFLFRLLPSDFSFIFMGVSLVILFGVALRDLTVVMKKSKFEKHINKLYLVVMLILVITQLIPGFLLLENISKHSPTKDYISAFGWLKKTPKDSTVLAIPEEGHFISYFGERKNVMDTEYLLIDDVEVKYTEVTSFFKQILKIEAITILDKYNAEYFIFSEKTKDKYNIEKLRFVDEQCFDVVYNSTVIIYKWDKEECEPKNI